MSFTVEQILEWSKGKWVNASVTQGTTAQIRVQRVMELGASGPTDLAYFFAKEFQDQIRTARAGILITADPFVGPIEKSGLPLWKSTAIISCPDPYRTMGVLSKHFASLRSPMSHTEARTGFIHPTAIVAPDAKIGKGVSLGAGVVVESGAEIGARSILYPGVFVGPAAKLGEDCILFPNVTVYENTVMGARVRVHAGSVIGADGFGYAPIVEGGQVTGHQKIYHTGQVVIEDDVEIGANSCVDRATFGETRICKNAKLDNLVQIGHNAVVGEGAVICGGTCLAGSTSVGRYAYIGGLTGVANKVHIGDFAKVGACSLMTKDVPPGTSAVGNPQREYREHFKVHAELNRMIKRKQSHDSK